MPSLSQSSMLSSGSCGGSHCRWKTPHFLKQLAVAVAWHSLRPWQWNAGRPKDWLLSLCSIFASRLWTNSPLKWCSSILIMPPSNGFSGLRTLQKERPLWYFEALLVLGRQRTDQTEVSSCFCLIFSGPSWSGTPWNILKKKRKHGWQEPSCHPCFLFALHVQGKPPARFQHEGFWYPLTTVRLIFSEPSASQQSKTVTPETTAFRWHSGFSEQQLSTSYAFVGHTHSFRQCLTWP